MAELSERIRELLSDPDAAEKIAAIAGSLSAGGGGQSPGAASGSSPGEVRAVSPAAPAGAAGGFPGMRPAAKRDPKLELLQALRPFVGEEKQERLDDLLRIMTVANLVLPLLGRREKGGNGLV